MVKTGNVTTLPSVYRDPPNKRTWDDDDLPCRSLVLIQRDSKHQSVTQPTTIQPLVFSCTYCCSVLTVTI